MLRCVISWSASPCFFLFFKCSCGNLFGLQKHIPATSDVVNYNTITNASFILVRSEIRATSVTSGLASEKYLAERRQGGGGSASANTTALTPMFSILCQQLVVPQDFAHKFPLT